MDYPDFKTFLHDKLRERGMSLKRLSELSGVAVKRLEAIAKEDPRTLPDAPYLRGYLERIGKALEFDGDAWWRYFHESGSLKRSGPSDTLPANRFALRPVATRLWIGILAAGIVLYVFFRFSEIFGVPAIEIVSPEGSGVVQATSSPLTIRGIVRGADTLLVQKEEVALGPGGTWEKEISLKPELNAVEIRAKRFLGRETTKILQILYEPPAPAPPEGSEELAPHPQEEPLP